MPETLPVATPNCRAGVTMPQHRYRYGVCSGGLETTRAGWALIAAGKDGQQAAFECDRAHGTSRGMKRSLDFVPVFSPIGPLPRVDEF